MSESRREALKLSVAAALGLSGCQTPPSFLGVSPSSDMDGKNILVRTGVTSWVLLQYNDPQTYHAYRYLSASVPVKPNGLPDIGSVTSPPDNGNWLDYPSNTSISIYNVSGTSLPVGANALVQTSDVKNLAQQTAGVAQTAWNEIGKQ